MGRIRQKALVVLAAAAVTIYFAHHAMHGRYGLETRARLIDRRLVASSRLASLEAARIELQRDVALIGADVPDADLVEEMARSVLGYAYPGERVILSATGTR